VTSKSRFCRYRSNRSAGDWVFGVLVFGDLVFDVAFVVFAFDGARRGDVVAIA
jgi:hypothetical protein